MSDVPAPAARAGGAWLRAALLILPTAAALYWSYASALRGMWLQWQKDENYSVGMLVPVAALFLLWHIRRQLATCVVRPSFWGLGLIGLALWLRQYAVQISLESLERYSFVLMIAGLTLLLAGTAVFWKARWVLAFLLLMVPLPQRVHNAISPRLQEQATSATVVVLELAGVRVEQAGNTLVLNDTTHVAVAEACSGLRMLAAFVVVAAVFAFIANRPMWQRVTLVCSSVLIAVICNLIRLVTTCVLYMVTTGENAKMFFHDGAGITMMPLAILMMLGELWLLNKLVVPDAPAARPRPVARPGSAAAKPKHPVAAGSGSE